MKQGNVIVLNGPPSELKAALAQAVRERVGPSVAVLSIDIFHGFMHPDTKVNWHLSATLNDALFATAVVLSNAGFDVVVETVFERKEVFTAMQRTLGDQPYRLIAVTSPVDLLDLREVARGSVLHDATYDAIIDTHSSTLDECVDRIVALL